MRAKFLPLLGFLALVACAHNPVPEGYAGPLARFKDSVTSPDGGINADFFYLEKVNDKKIENSRNASIQAAQNRGFAKVAPVILEREVPAQSAVFTIVGRTNHFPPIVAMMSTEYEVRGDITFVPSQNAKYVVKGQLGESYSAVWIEDEATNQVVGSKIEIQGSAKLNLFQK